MQSMLPLANVYVEQNSFMVIFYTPLFEPLLPLIQEADENVDEQKEAAKGIAGLVLATLDL